MLNNVRTGYDSQCMRIDRMLICWGVNHGSPSTEAPWEYTTPFILPSGTTYTSPPSVVLMPYGVLSGSELDRVPILWTVSTTQFVVRNMLRAFQWIAVGYTA